jgi:hypothetical protein
MSLQQPKCDGPAQCVDDKVNIRVGAKLSALDRTTQDESRQAPAAFGKFG